MEEPAPPDRPLRNTCWITLGIVFPAAFLWAAAVFRDVNYQSGAWSDYGYMVHYWPHLWMVYLLLLFPAAALIGIVHQQEELEPPLWIRFGLLTGALLWGELWIAWLIALVPLQGLVLSVLSPIVGVIVVGFLVSTVSLESREEVPPVRQGIAVLGVTLFAGSLLLWPLWLLALHTATPLAFMTYCWASYESLRTIKPKNRRLSLKLLMLFIAWLSANFTAWKLAIDAMLAEYATLPTEPPDDCFVASAAAKGHRWFVGAERAPPITPQLRTLKAGELLIRHTAPRLHAAMRWIYNRLGPCLASRLTNRWLADAAYLMLKPFEWIAWLLLRIAGVSRERVASLYRRRP